MNSISNLISVDYQDHGSCIDSAVIGGSFQTLNYKKWMPPIH